MKSVTIYRVFDWANNEINSPVFSDFDDACDWLNRHIEKLYGKDLSDDRWDEEIGEFNIVDVTSDEDLRSVK